MQKITLVIGVLLLTFSLNAQQLNFELGKTISSFIYKNSENLELNNLNGSTNNHLGIDWKAPFRKSDFYFISGLSYNKYGTKGSDSILFNYYDWELNYVGVNMGLGYEFFKADAYFDVNNINKQQGFTFYTQLSISSDFLVQGTQTINEQVYNLIGVEQFDKPFIFANAGIGIIYYASKTISANAQYMAGRSLPIFNSESNEKLDFFTHTVCLGFFINLQPRTRW